LGGGAEERGLRKSTDAELLTHLLGLVVSAGADEAAERAVARFGSFAAVLAAPEIELRRLPGPWHSQHRRHQAPARRGVAPVPGRDHVSATPRLLRSADRLPDRCPGTGEHRAFSHPVSGPSN
jgi:hypothetical protein